MLISTLLHSWRQNWQQILFVVLGMLSGVAGLSSVLIINETAKQKINGLNDTLLSDIYAVASLEPGKTFTKYQYAELRKSGLLLVAASRFTRNINNTPIQFMALDSSAVLTAASLKRTTSSATTPENFNFFKKTPKGQIRLDHPQTSKSYFEHVISELKKEDFLPFPFPEPSSQINENLVYMSLSQASVLNEPLSINELWIISEPSATQIEELEATGFKFKFIEYQQSNITSSFHINIFAMGGLMLVVSFFVVLNAYHLLLSGRHGFVKQLYVVGISLKALRNLFILEAWFWAFICIFLGFFLGELLASLLAPGVKQTLEGLYDVSFGEQRAGILVLKVQIAAVTIAAITVTIIFPVNQMLQQLAADISGKHKSTSQKPQFLSFLLILLVISTIAISEFIFSQSLLMSFVTIILVVLTGCIASISLLPMLAHYVKSKVPERLPITFYFASDAVRLSHRNKIAFCAFFIAITANIGMNIMVDSFRQATQSWLNTQFVADLYLGTESPELIRRWQQKQTDLFIYEREKATIQFNGQRTELIAMPESGVKLLNLKLKTQDNATTPATETMVFINEQLSLRAGITPGNTLTVAGNELYVKGIYYDYGNMQNQIIANVRIVRTLQKKPPLRHLFSVSKVNQQQDDKALQEFTEFLKANGINWFTGENIRNLSVNIFDQTFVITSVLNVVTLLVAGISLATSIIIVAHQNKHHYNILRQMGVKQSQIRRAIFVQYWYIVTLLFICAIPFGLLLSWLLIYKINYLSFFWTYPMVINLTPIVLVYLLAMTTITICLLLAFSFRRTENRINLASMTE